jgi:hypothetical protein
MNVIIYWQTGDYADVYNVDDVDQPSDNEEDLRLYRNFRGEKFEVARFKGTEMRGWQIFLTLDDSRRDERPR